MHRVAIIIRLDENGLKQSAPTPTPLAHLPLSELPILSLFPLLGLCFSVSPPDTGLTLGRLVLMPLRPLNNLTVEAAARDTRWGVGVLRIVNMQSNGVSFVPSESGPARRVTLGLFLHGWLLLGKVLYTAAANSHLIAQAFQSPGD